MLVLVLVSFISHVLGRKCQPPLSGGLDTPHFIESTMVEMRDGVHLHTNVLSKGKKTKRYPVVLDRSPYGGFGTELIADIFTALGDYIAVGQDMRGTCRSEGNFSIWRKDGQDAFDTMKWIVQQPWSDGRVFSLGASADGIAEFVVALEDPSQYLVAEFIIWATPDARATVYPGGAYRQSLISGWLKSTVPEQAADAIKLIKSHNGASSWWDPLNVSRPEVWKDFKAPAVFWAGWYDIFLQGNLNGHYIYQNLAAPSIRGKSYLFVDPLGHCQEAGKYFPFTEGELADRKALGALLALQMFKGNGTITKAAEGIKKITFYVMGPDPKVAPQSKDGNFWCSVDTWPTYTPTPFALTADGGMQLASRPGSGPDIHLPSPLAVGNRSYRYDPQHPVPTLGGNNLEISPCGPVDQRPVENRSDVLLHTTSPLTEALYVTGPMSTTLFVSAANVNDTDFTAKLTDVYPDGSSHLIQDGIIRMRWRLGADSSNIFWPTQPTLIRPGVVYKVTVDLWNTSYVFNKGHRIRLAISSSNSPRFKANPNLGLDLNEEDAHTPIVAHNTLYYGSTHPSSLSLPVVTRKQLPRHLIPFLGGKADCSGQLSEMEPKAKLWCAARRLAKFLTPA